MKNFFVFFSMAILVVVGFFLIFLAIGVIPVEEIKQILVFIQEEQIIYTIIVGALLLGGGCYLFYILAREIYLGSTISFKNPEGEVKVLLSAIEEFLKRLEGRLDGVREMKPKLLITKKGLGINARITLEPNVNIPEATTRIQETLREYVEGVLGIKNIVSIKVLITKIADEYEREESEVTRP